MAIQRLAVFGDSLSSRLTNSNSAYSQGGLGSWADLVGDRLGNIAGLGPRISSGMRFMTGGSGVSEWTTGGSWTGVVSTDAFDKAPYGILVDASTATTFRASGSTFTRSYTLPASEPAAVGFQITYVDYASGGNWSYRVNGGAYTNMGQTLAHDNKLAVFYVSAAVLPGQTIDLRAADASGTAAGCLPVCIEMFYQAPTVTQGFILDDYGIGATNLHDLCATTTGDRLAILGTGTDGAVKLGTGSPLAPAPTLGVLLMHINDLRFVNNSTTWATDLTTFNSRKPAGVPLLLQNPYEGDPALYNTTTQATYRAQTKTSAAGFSPAAAVLDHYDKYVSQGFTGNAPVVAAGLVLSSDKLHPTQAGYFSMAERIYWFVRTQLLSAYSGAPSTYTATGKLAPVQYAGKRATVQYQAGQLVSVA